MASTQTSNATNDGRPNLGLKRVCPSCQAKFYDFNRDPFKCPKCQSEYSLEEFLSAISSRKSLDPVQNIDEADGEEDADGDDEEETDQFGFIARNQDDEDDDLDDDDLLEDEEDDDEDEL